MLVVKIIFTLIMVWCFVMNCIRLATEDKRNHTLEEYLTIPAFILFCWIVAERAFF